MDTKKALMKGLRNISREEFTEAAKLFAKQKRKDNNEFEKDKQLREKYPVYDEVVQMVVRTAQTQEEMALLHTSGMQSALRILLHIAERK